jgi:hypothetical protein
MLYQTCHIKLPFIYKLIMNTNKRLINWLNFTSHLRIFHLYGDVTIAGEGLQNLGLCLVLRVFEQVGIFIVLHLLWHWTSVFPVSSDRPRRPIQSPYTTHEGMSRIYFSPDPYWSNKRYLVFATSSLVLNMAFSGMLSIFRLCLVYIREISESSISRLTQDLQFIFRVPITNVIW